MFHLLAVGVGPDEPFDPILLLQPHLQIGSPHVGFAKRNLGISHFLNCQLLKLVHAVVDCLGHDSVESAAQAHCSFVDWLTSRDLKRSDADFWARRSLCIHWSVNVWTHGGSGKSHPVDLIGLVLGKTSV